MRRIELSAGEIVSAMLGKTAGGQAAILDSCGVGKAGTNRLIAGVEPIEILRLCDSDPEITLSKLEKALARDDVAAVFTISYDFGLKLNRVTGNRRSREPDIFLALFDGLIVHDYDNGRSFAVGSTDRTPGLAGEDSIQPEIELDRPVDVASNFDRSGYLAMVEKIKDRIRAGDTYQTNLTQQLSAKTDLPPAAVYRNLRREHPAAFAAYIDRGDSIVISASPEQFFRIDSSESGRVITASPIKGTRPRGTSNEEDARLRQELLNSEKDRAENTMIVDLMRNDLGRVCEFGSVTVAELCRIDEHPTLFHLVSTVKGSLRSGIGHADVIRALFPCGSITGAPKISTMGIIDELEGAARGLSMGAIGCRIPAGWLAPGEIFEASVAIRTMTICDGRATFNVGGGVVIDSDAAGEYEESLLKAKALLTALGVDDQTFSGK